MISTAKADVKLETTYSINASFETNFTNFISVVKNTNSSKKAPPFMNATFEPKKSMAVSGQAKTGPVSINNKTTFESDGKIKNESSITMGPFPAVVPFDISTSTSQSSNGESGLSLGVILKPRYLEIPMSVEYTRSTNGDKKLEAKVGAEVTIGEKSGIKIFGASSLGFKIRQKNENE